MWHQTITCDRCGQAAIVINATPIYANADALLKSETTQTAAELSCRINCPQCGLQVQVVKAQQD